MKLHLQQTGDANVIRAFEPGRIRVNDTICTRSLILTPERLDTDWPVTHVSQIGEETLVRLLDFGPDIILLGTGNRHCILDASLMMTALQRGVGIEAMSTDAACRTYNVLLGEDRRVLAALIVETPTS